jgi:lipid A 3-O-deacylase
MRLLRLVAAILTLTLFSATAFAIDRIDLSVGGVTRPSLDSPYINSFHASLTWNTDYLESEGDNYQRSLRFETGVGLNHTYLKDIHDISVSPILHYQVTKPNWPDFFEIGVGAAYISDIHWKPYHDMGSHFSFADRIGFGYDLGTTEISLNFFHISNGGIKEPNPGADMILLRTSFKL